MRRFRGFPTAGGYIPVLSRRRSQVHRGTTSWRRMPLFEWRVQTRGPRPVPTQITGLNAHSLNLSTLKTWSIWSWIYSISPLSWSEYKKRSGFPNCNAAPQDPSSPLWWARARPAGRAVPPRYGVDLEANRTTPAVNTSSIFLGIYTYLYLYLYIYIYTYT